MWRIDAVSSDLVERDGDPLADGTVRRPPGLRRRRTGSGGREHQQR
jgi:hypothetical protein